MCYCLLLFLKTLKSGLVRRRLTEKKVEGLTKKKVLCEIEQLVKKCIPKECFPTGTTYRLGT